MKKRRNNYLVCRITLRHLHYVGVFFNGVDSMVYIEGIDYHNLFELRPFIAVIGLLILVGLDFKNKTDS